MLDIKIAKVYVDKTSFHFDKQFDYIVPLELTQTIRRGCRVIVPFGNGNRKYQGMVYDVFSVDEVYNKLKPISFLLDKEPIFTDEMFKIADFMVKNTFCTYYEAVKTILPTGISVNFFETYKLCKDFDKMDFTNFSQNEKNLLDFLVKAKNDKEINEILTYSQNSNKKSVITSLIEKNIVIKTESFKPKATEKTMTMIRLSSQYLNSQLEIKLTPKQNEVVDFLKSVSNSTKKEILYFCGITDGVVKNLIKKNLLESFEVPIIQEKLLNNSNEDLSSLKLSPMQSQVYTEIYERMNVAKAGVGLLLGITGSGKTQIFIKLIEDCINDGKQALMLVPEISLTPQMVTKFKTLFPNQVAVIHSNLSLRERTSEYNRIKNNEVKIVVGTRSAVFAPFENIGIIVMDEEGEYSYKSDANPRYHAREIAKLRCVHHNAFLLLASATPSVESYYKAKTGVYSLHELHERFSGAQLPEVYIVDMHDELMAGNSGAISSILKNEIEKNINNHEQSIILINRRGYNTVLECVDCGEVLKCKHCDVPLTYHKSNGYMMCHHCGYSVPKPNKCFDCGSERVKFLGFGTQRIENDLEELFPNARILRMDTDTTGSKFAYSEKFTAFANQEYDILIGTQMIAKGLDFENVTLVGVLNVDSGLYSSDYRAVERVFSLITQVVGRSGRAQKKGRAFIQTQMVNNSVINFAAQQDYASFYEDEIFSRQALKYPPFCDICVITISATKEETAKRASKVFLKLMQKNANNDVKGLNLSALGPVEATIYKLNNKFREKILIKCKFNKVFREYIKEIISQTSVDTNFRNVSISVDVNGDINI